jgi:hypothetical protein
VRTSSAAPADAGACAASRPGASGVAPRLRGALILRRGGFGSTEVSRHEVPRFRARGSELWRATV